MPEERTVLDHLLEGRDALQREVQRLTAAIEELDSVLGRLGTVTRRDDGSANPEGTADTSAHPLSSDPVASGPISAQPVNPPAEVEAVQSAPAMVRTRPRGARKAPAKRSSRPRVTGAGDAPKSIRVHVLEMLQEENREFGLAEIIDRVHAAGIQAHDDAVRSITIKLMKDGRVERVGRGQYRLARRGSAARHSAAVTTTPRVTEVAPEPDPLPVAAEPLDEPAFGATSTYEPARSPIIPPEAIDTSGAIDTSDAFGTPDAGESDAEQDEAQQSPLESFGHAGPIETPTETLPEVDQSASAGSPEPEPEPESDSAQSESESAERGNDGQSAPPPYSPPLNLGQPWNS